MKLSFLAALVFFVPLCDALPGSSRDFDRYETRGPYVLHERVITWEDRALLDAQIRQFLWDCWQRHRLARLITIAFSMEGMPTRTTYFIEPDERRQWRVVVETISTIQDPPGSKDKTFERTVVGVLEETKTADGQQRLQIRHNGESICEL